VVLIFMLIFQYTYSQVEKFPVFEDCKSVSVEELENCFYKQVLKNFQVALKVPQKLLDENFKGAITITFIVDNSGQFKVLYVNSPYPEFKTEMERVFSTFPQIKPATYNNLNTEMQFVLPLQFPLGEEMVFDKKKQNLTALANQYLVKNQEKLDYTSDNNDFLAHQSQLNIPFSSQDYSVLDFYYQNSENSHTAAKPFIYTETMNYVDLNQQKKDLLKDKKGWWGRKFWNEHMVQIKADDYWFTLDPAADLQLGKDNSDDFSYTYNNTRAVIANGGIGKNFNFSATVYESQGRFSEYFNQYAESIKPDGGNPAIIPARGIAKPFQSNAYDYPVTEGYLSYSPNKTFNIQFGHGKNFIGDGYRSLFLSDVSSPYPYLKINTSFWKLKYTNLWMWTQDVRREATVNGAYAQKYVAIHYLSLNVTKKLNIGLFEAAIWDKSNNRGMDVNFINPIIFLTNVEFATGSRSGNTMLGLSTKYKWNQNIALYSQLIVDDFRVGEIANGNGYWSNKFGIQLGAKYFNAFKIDNLQLQAEYNAVNPYTYSHDELLMNYGHNNQPMAHLWGANFREFIGIARYTKDRWFGNAKLIFGEKGFDFNTSADRKSYGGDVFKDNDDRATDYGNKIGQGNTAKVFMGDLQVGYLINPATNLKLFGGITYRNFNPETPTNTFDKTNTTWFNIGFRTDVFNWYFDF
ncbi:MAG TPA: gliding motility protein RemB, partial [Flavobacteriaceae bacterium]|nr:gliding motility protein RemB [Flavobacteriaceae bacterium]